MQKEYCKKYENFMIVTLTIALNIVVISIFFDYYYDLNDDVFMRDIMSGAYTGTPDGHNVQTLYVLGAFISLLYKLVPTWPWYGIFLIACQMGSLFLIGGGVLRFCREKKTKVGCMALLTLFMAGIILPHIAAPHYTFISAMLAAAAIFLFMTMPDELTTGQFIGRNMVSVLLAVLAYQLRTEMLLLLFPFICLAGLFRWSDEEKVLEKKNYFKYGIVLCSILLGMLVSRLIDFAAYSDGDWKEYLVFFNKRTEVYDFHMDVVTSGEHKDELYSIGLSNAQQKLLSNYNFGLDESIDAQLMGEIAAYAVADTDYWGEISEQFRYYIYRTLGPEDAPYSRMVIYLYLCVLIVGLYISFIDKTNHKRWSFLWKLPLLGMVRTSLWMFILVRGRRPERITHSLYYTEAALLLGMLIMQLSSMRKIREKVYVKTEKMRNAVQTKAVFVIFMLFGLLCLWYVPQSVEKVVVNVERREKSHQNCLEIAKYCEEHDGNFYFKDTYSTVGSSQKIFRDVNNTLANHDIMGGWLCKSPLYDEKLEKFGMTSMEEGLLGNDKVYFITSQGSDTSWLTAYYMEKGIAVDVEQVDLIGDIYAVYQLRKI